MIIHTGARTDTVQYYTPWLLRRFAEGYVLVRNPRFSYLVTRYELTPDKVDAIVFCSKNYRPILKALPSIMKRFPAQFQYTITAYGKDIEPGVPSIDESIQTLYELERVVGRQRVSWRYDPVLFTAEYTLQRHLDTFQYMAEKIAGHVDRCIFSFVEMYKKLRRNMPEIVPLTSPDKERAAKALGCIAAKYRLPIQICGTGDDYSACKIASAGCLTLSMLEKANGLLFQKMRHSGNRKGCHCIETRDIGAYDSCPNGCRYCYANQSPTKVKENYKYHDPDSPLLLGRLRATDQIRTARQISFLACRPEAVQQTLDL